MFCLFLPDVAGKRKTTITYDSLGAGLDTAKVLVIERSKSTRLTSDEKRDMMNAYNKAVLIYKNLGNTAIVAIDVGSKVEQKKYYAMREEIISLMNIVNKFIDKGGR